MADIKSSMQHMMDCVKDASLDQFQIFTKVQDAEMGETSIENLAYSQQMTHILITATDIEVNFKTHFMLKDAGQFVASKLGADPKTERQCVDFMKEYCNVVAGKVKAMLEKADVMAGQSLPFAIQGYNEMFYPKASEDKLHGAWKISCKLGEIVCSTTIEIRSEDILPNINNVKYAEGSGSESGDIELF